MESTASHSASRGKSSPASTDVAAPPADDPRNLDCDTLWYDALKGECGYPLNRFYTVAGGGLRFEHIGHGLTCDRVIAHEVGCFLDPDLLRDEETGPLDLAIWELEHLVAIVRIFPDGKGTWRVRELGPNRLDWPLWGDDPLSDGISDEYPPSYPQTYDTLTDSGTPETRRHDAINDRAAGRLVDDEEDEALADAGVALDAALGACGDPGDPAAAPITDAALAAAAQEVENWDYLVATFRHDFEVRIGGDEDGDAKTILDVHLAPAIQDRTEAECRLRTLLEGRPDVVLKIGERWYGRGASAARTPTHRVAVVPTLAAVAAIGGGS